MIEKLYCVKFYINNKLDKLINNLTIKEAYNIAAPKEAYEDSFDNKWHLILYPYLYEEVVKMKIGETIRVAWNNVYTQHILIEMVN
jgi:hypothetical protein